MQKSPQTQVLHETGSLAQGWHSTEAESLETDCVAREAGPTCSAGMLTLLWHHLPGHPSPSALVPGTVQQAA